MRDWLRGWTFGLFEIEESFADGMQEKKQCFTPFVIKARILESQILEYGRTNQSNGQFQKLNRPSPETSSILRCDIALK
jgi:hypothetical protein